MHHRIHHTWFQKMLLWSCTKIMKTQLTNSKISRYASIQFRIQLIELIKLLILLNLKYIPWPKISEQCNIYWMEKPRYRQARICTSILSEFHQLVAHPHLAGWWLPLFMHVVITDNLIESFIKWQVCCCSYLLFYRLFNFLSSLRRAFRIIIIIFIILNELHDVSCKR